MLYQTHLGSPEEFNSISGWMTLLRTDTRIWDAKRKTIKNFRACHSFFNTVLDAHILALYGSFYNAPDCDTLRSIPSLHNWRKPILRLSPLVHDTTHVRTLREAAETDRDLLRENTILFLQHGLMYREFSNAIDNGDPGAIEHCLSYFAVWLHSTGKFNYSVESAHLVACLRKIWSPEAKGFWQDTCLVNSSGKSTGYMACDMLCEYLVRELKDLLQSWSTKFLREVVATQIFTFRDIRKTIQRQCSATDYGLHSSEVSSWQNVRPITSKLLAIGAFREVVGRGSGPAPESRRQCVDLYEAGLMKLSTGAPLEKYKMKMIQGYLVTGSGVGERLMRVGGLSDNEEDEAGDAEEESSDSEEMEEIETDEE